MAEARTPVTPPPAPRSGWRARLHWERLEDPVERRVRAGLVLLLVGLLAHLAFGDNPWHDGIAKRLRDGDPVRAIDYAATYGWWMAAVNAAAVAALLATRRRWLHRGRVPEAVPVARGDLRAGAWFVPLVVGAALLTAALAAPRMDDSLWGDEEWTVRRAIDGNWVVPETGEIRYEQVGWRETFFDVRKPSNHVGYCVLARACLAAWRTVARPELPLANEAAVRLPAFAAGIAAVVFVALLGRRLALPAAGVLAAWILALHPWHLRYASEARAYGLLVLGVPLALWALLRALERGSWGRWTLYGATQFWMMWSWPLSAFFVVVLNGAAAGTIWRTTRGGGGDARVQWTRWAVVCAVGGLLWLQLMLGPMVQLTSYLERESLPMGLSWLVDLGAHWIAGVGFGPDRPHYHDLVEVAGTWPTTFRAFAWASGLAAVLGLGRLLAGGAVRALVAGVLLLPAPLLVAWALREETFLNHWYLLWTLPGLALAVGAGIETAARWLPTRLRAGGMALAMTAWLAVFGAVTWPARTALLAGSLQPMRESVLRTRPSLDPNDPANARVLTASIQREPAYYDPRVVRVTRPRELERLMARADAEGLPLFVNYGRPGLARKRVPALVEMVERPDLFEPVAVLYGFEPRGERRVYRYRGARP